MTNEQLGLPTDEVLSWFDDSENFKYLPQDIQDKIINFFTEQAAMAVDACQIIEFLEFGRNFTVYYDYAEFMNSLYLSSTKAILACKANFNGIVRIPVIGISDSGATGSPSA